MYCQKYVSRRYRNFFLFIRAMCIPRLFLTQVVDLYWYPLEYATPKNRKTETERKRERDTTFNEIKMRECRSLPIIFLNVWIRHETPKLSIKWGKVFFNGNRRVERSRFSSLRKAKRIQFCRCTSSIPLDPSISCGERMREII